MNDQDLKILLTQKNEQSVIESEKYLKDIDVVSHFQNMNKTLPIKYLKRNHIQYEFVSYVSMVGTLFIGRNFEGAGIFIQRAYFNLKSLGEEHFDKAYLEKAMMFLKVTSDYLMANELIPESLKHLIQNEIGSWYQ